MGKSRRYEAAKDLRNSLENISKRVYELQEKCYEILLDTYQEKEKIQFPVDIKRVADCMGIQIFRQPLNYLGGKKIDQNIAQLQYVKEGEKVVRRIILDDMESGFVVDADSLSDLERYAIAYEMGKTIVGEYTEEDDLSDFDVEWKNIFSVPYSLPRLSAQLENFEYELCAIFLLLPLQEFLDAFWEYIEVIQEHPVMMERWIKHLSDVAEIPNYQLVNGYPYIKLCAYQYYMHNFSEINKEFPEEERDRLERQRELFQ